MSERRWWLVTEASTTAHDMMHGAVFVEAATDEEAAARGMAMLWEEAWARSEGGEPEPVHDVAVFEGVGRRWRATVGAELVPDEFQCCGGMPATPLGTYDEHTATCPAKTPTPESVGAAGPGRAGRQQGRGEDSTPPVESPSGARGAEQSVSGPASPAASTDSATRRPHP